MKQMNPKRELRFNLYLLLLLLAVLIGLKIVPVEVNFEVNNLRISVVTRQTLAEWKYCYQGMISRRSHQLWEKLEWFTGYCRYKTLLHRVETRPLPRENGDILYQIYKNGFSKLGRTILVIDNNMDSLTFSHLKPQFSEDSALIVANTSDFYPDCNIRNPDKCEGGSSESSLLTVQHSAHPAQSGDMESIFSSLNLTIVDYLLLHENSYELLPKINRHDTFDQMNVTICQIAAVINAPGVHNAENLEDKFRNLWESITWQGRFAPLQVTTAGRKNILLVNIEHPYCIANYIEPFMKLEE